MGGNHGIRLVSGSGLSVFLLNPPKTLDLRLEALAEPNDGFFVGMPSSIPGNLAEVDHECHYSALYLRLILNAVMTRRMSENKP